VAQDAPPVEDRTPRVGHDEGGQQKEQRRQGDQSKGGDRQIEGPLGGSQKGPAARHFCRRGATFDGS
jgi:hypothetical protein